MKSQLIIGLLSVGVLFIVGAFHTATLAQRIGRNAASHTGAIQGRVKDAEGRPLSGVTVKAKADGPNPGALFETYTDKEGGFFFREVTPRVYTVYATRDIEGYQDISFAFLYGKPWAVKVTVYEQRIAKGVVVWLNTKTARLDGRVIDVETGYPVVNARILLCRADNPKNCLGTGANSPNGQFRLMIPLIALRIKVSAPGYEDWYYRKNGLWESSEVLELELGATKELIISLQPSK